MNVHVIQGMNKLRSSKRVQILTLLCEGMSLRAISRAADVSFNTVTKLLVDAGKACADFDDEKVRGVRGRHPGHPPATTQGSPPVQPAAPWLESAPMRVRSGGS
jgi:hypothetical protein